LRLPRLCGALSVEYWFVAPTLTETAAEHVDVPAAHTR
jgi:hypothetical protein